MEKVSGKLRKEASEAQAAADKAAKEAAAATLDAKRAKEDAKMDYGAYLALRFAPGGAGGSAGGVGGGAGEEEEKGAGEEEEKGEEETEAPRPPSRLEAGVGRPSGASGSGRAPAALPSSKAAAAALSPAEEGGGGGGGGRGKGVEKEAPPERSGFTNVSYIKRSGNWLAAFCYKTVHYHVGYFDTPEAAAEALDQKKRDLIKEGKMTRAAARFNYPLPSDNAVDPAAGEGGGDEAEEEEGGEGGDGGGDEAAEGAGGEGGK